VRRLFAWATWLVGALAFYRWLRGRRPAPVQAVADADPRAAELRAKLEESRALVDEQEQDAAESGEPAVGEVDPDERRRRVHDEGRAAVERMRQAGEKL
jgi:hypothetical protein